MTVDSLAARFDGIQRAFDKLRPILQLRGCHLDVTCHKPHGITARIIVDDKDWFAYIPGDAVAVIRDVVVVA